MSSYKVPQDVEADDKLLGPFSFRQFVYLMIAAVSIGVGWLLFTIFPPLVILPLPFVLLFGALALPLRKDQPMEIYLAARLSFILKPRRRLWDPDGIESLVQIAAPRVTEPQRTKNISSDEAERRLRYLSNLSDTHGWSVRGVFGPNDNIVSSMNDDVYNEAQQTEDLLDDSGVLAQNLTQMISQTDQRRHKDMVDRFQAAATNGVSISTPPAAPTYTPPDPYVHAILAPPQDIPPQPDGNDIFRTAQAAHFNPYPQSMNQAVIQPLSEQSKSQQKTDPAATSATPVSADIIKLANNADLSIDTIAREAHRINEKVSSDDTEVVISLR